MLEAALEGIFEEVVAGVFLGARVCAEFGGREDELPGPFPWGVGVFAGEGFGHVDLADAGDEVLAVFFAEGGEVGLESGFEGLGERDEAVFAAFGVVDGNGAVAEVDVLDAESETFHNAEPGAVEELGGEFPGVFEESEHGTNFVAGEYGGRAPATGGRAIEVQREFGVTEDVAEEEDESVERLLLGGGGDLAFQGEEMDIGGDGGWADLGRRLTDAAEAEPGEPEGPMTICLFCGYCEVFKADDAAEVGVNLGEGFGFAGGGDGVVGARWADVESGGAGVAIGVRGGDGTDFAQKGAVGGRQIAGLIGK